MSKQKSIENMTFEEAICELEYIVQNIDSGQETLSSSIENFEYGVKLRDHCDKMLKNAKLKIDKVVKFHNDTVKLEAISDIDD